MRPLETTELVDARTGLPQAKQLKGGGSAAPLISRQFNNSFTEHSSAHQSKTQFSPAQALPSGSVHKTLSLIYQRADVKSKKNYNPAASRMKLTSQKVINC